MKTTTITRSSLALLVTALLSVTSSNTGWAKSAESKVKTFIDDAADSLKHGIDKCGDNLEALQDYLDGQPWKDAIQEVVPSGPASLKDLQLNGHSKVVAVRPGERIDGIVLCNLDRDQCSSLSMYRVVLGIQGQGAQTTIGNEFGILAGESLEKFSLIAPTEPGVYQIRFRLVESFFEKDALKAWVDENGEEPSITSTIGLILVK